MKITKKQRAEGAWSSALIEYGADWCVVSLEVWSFYHAGLNDVVRRWKGGGWTVGTFSNRDGTRYPSRRAAIAVARMERA